MLATAAAIGAAAGFWSGPSGEVATGIIYTLLAALLIAVVRAVMKTYGKHQEQNRDDQGLKEFFFDTPGNPRTGVPFRKGWTTLIDERQTRMERSQERMERKLDTILGEVTEDGNGGHNFRGEVKRAVEERREEF